ncbi:aquaporin-9 [Trichonephila inaurata madagascariensis]|uniref:Aquaporin-9 n=1 Tax=Trichonephila inaurata madagascariensis TaxID=2747483 RepID=A0A8X7CKQ3_9ARAC|nr:aquaporin-9 [Trichonephila inaurata madagascariensis]
MSETVPYGFLRKLRIRNIVVREFLGEFLGTFILIIFGDAAFAQAVLEGRKVADDVFAVVWAWGVAVMLGVATCANISGGHINPAVTVAFATLGKFPWKKVGHYLLAQHLGAFVASAVLFVTYKDALDYIDPNRTITGETATAYIWATYPKPYVSILSCLLDQIVGTGLLMFTALAIIDTKNLNMPKWMHPIFLGFMISALAMCFGANCMAPLNPARDFATRCFTAVAGYGSEVFRKIYFILGFLLVLSSCKGHVGSKTILGNQKSSVLSHNAQNSNDCPSIIPKPMDCEEVRRNGFNTSGVYTIWPRNRIITKETARVYCDMTTNGGGWTVIQRRGDFGSPPDYFNKNWNYYKRGFGAPTKDFWIGNDLIYALTNQGSYSVRFEMQHANTTNAYALYEEFWIDDEDDNYKLHISGYSGTAGKFCTILYTCLEVILGPLQAI